MEAGIKMSDNEALKLSQDGLNEIAELAGDNLVSAEELRGITPEVLVLFKEYLKNKERAGINKETLMGLEGLVAKISETPVSVAVPNTPQSSVIVDETKNKKENEKKETEKIDQEFHTLSESHGYLYAFARAFTMGYIPQTHDNKFFSGKEAPIDLVRKMKWVAFG